MGRLLHLDPFSGMAGDMFLGALVDAGLAMEALESALRGLPVDNFRLVRETVHRGAIRATKLRVIIRRSDGVDAEEGRDAPLGGDDAEHPSPGHGRSLREILDLIESAAIPEAARDRAAAIFRLLGEAEAKVHGKTLETVHFHEVGAIDSIVDVCGAAVALDLLDVDQVTASAVAVGSGVRRMAHGTLPLPAPATAELLCGLPVRRSGIADELLTPTGAAVLRTIVDRWDPVDAVTPRSVGYGAGSTDRADPPNVVRAVLCDTVDAGTTERVSVLETQVDDMTPEGLGFLRRRLEETEGILDVLITAVAMKKDRPGHAVKVIVRPGATELAEDVLFADSSTLGIRKTQVTRSVLERDVVSVDTPVGIIRVKRALRDGRVVRFAPEHDDCAAAARAAGRSLEEVRWLAETAARAL